MPAPIIAFFSSDARDLYKADVFRALALPKGYVLQFRYQRKYIHNELLANLNGLKGQVGQIVFVTGNNLQIPPEQRQLAFHPIRQVTIRDIYNDPNIETVHFYLQMGDFSDSAHHAATPVDHLPPNSYLSRITLQDSPDRNWISRVRAIESHFNKPLFFHVTAVKHKNKPIEPTYSGHDRSSRYPLNDEDCYQLEMAFYDPQGGKSGLAVENTSDDVVLNVPTTHSIGTEKDTTIFELHTHTLSKQRQIAYTYLQERDSNAAYRVQLQWNVTRGAWKPWLFGALSVLAATGLMGAKVATDDLQKLNLTAINYAIGAISVLGVEVAAGALYWLFNKK